MNSYLFINIKWPELAELLPTRPITIHEFHSTGKDCLNKTFFGVNLKFKILWLNLLYIYIFLWFRHIIQYRYYQQSLHA